MPQRVLPWNAGPRVAVPSRRWLCVAIFAVLTACGSDGSGGTGPATGSIAVTLTPASVSVPRGGSGSLGVTLTRGGAFAGPVTLTASGVPAGVTLTFGSSVVSATSTSISLTVAAGVPVGTTDIAIVGSGAGIVSPAATLTLRVQ